MCLFHLRPSRRASSTDSYGVPANCPDCGPAGLPPALPCCCSLPPATAASSASTPAKSGYVLGRKDLQRTCCDQHPFRQYFADCYLKHYVTVFQKIKHLLGCGATCLRHHSVSDLNAPNKIVAPTRQHSPANACLSPVCSGTSILYTRSQSKGLYLPSSPSMSMPEGPASVSPSLLFTKASPDATPISASVIPKAGSAAESALTAH